MTAAVVTFVVRSLKKILKNLKKEKQKKIDP